MSTEPLIEDEVMRRASSDNPKSRQHDERTADRRSMWRCVPIADVVGLRQEALATLDAARATPGANEGLRTALAMALDDWRRVAPRENDPDLWADQFVDIAAAHGIFLAARSARSAPDGLREAAVQLLEVLAEDDGPWWWQEDADRLRAALSDRDVAEGAQP